MILKLILLLGVLGYVAVLEVDLQRPEVTYTNPKYLEYLKLSVKRHSRRGPHYITLEALFLDDYSDNFTLNFVLYEQVSGRYIPTGIDASYRMCYFLHNEPYLGKMVSRQVPDFKCPGKHGKVVLPNMTANFAKFPFKIPFLWSQSTITGRADFNFYVTKTKERVAEFKVYATVTQKP